MRLIFALLVPVMLCGCVSTAASVITAPVRAAGQVVDWTTVSQDESDRRLGRQVRARDEELGRLQRRRDREAERCEDGNGDACANAEAYDEEIERLRRAPLPR